MRRDEITENLSSLAFDFFFWFSRFEFTLKENGYLKSHDIGVTAEPGWDQFVTVWREKYVLTPYASQLIALSPERHVVDQGDTLNWKPVGLTDCTFDLQRVVRLLKTVRNNLFHGGKHGGAGWSDPARTRALLDAARRVVDELATLANLDADYTQCY